MLVKSVVGRGVVWARDGQRGRRGEPTRGMPTRNPGFSNPDAEGLRARRPMGRELVASWLADFVVVVVESPWYAT
ncbi:unnamed protein product [Lasius platythorax]|uniref:Uncharacterized protein n=1 Tax=Lasius platythorax TaxID=488582 RepID=A0AAV2N1R7_9HYME